jgi:MFS superfamily sulfate permease-like transporter
VNPRNSVFEYFHFLKNNKTDTVLLLIVALMIAIFSLPRIVSIPLPIIVFFLGSILLFRQHEKGKLHEQRAKYVKKLRVLLDDLKDTIINESYSYSLPFIAMTIANDKQLINKTQAEKRLLLLLSTNLAKETNELIEEVQVMESKGERFYGLLEKFAKLLSNLSNFKTEFYNMIQETRTVVNLGSDLEFKTNFYSRFSYEYNSYMDKLSRFSDNLKEEGERGLNKDLIEHVKNLDELYGTK